MQTISRKQIGASGECIMCDLPTKSGAKYCGYCRDKALEIGEFEYNIKTAFGKILCSIFGHSKKRKHSRCNRCLTLILK